MWFSLQGPKHWTGKTCWEKLFVYSQFDREDSTANCGGNRVLFPASVISATEDFGSRHKNENIERTVYESTNIVWHPDVRYPNVCFNEKESQCQENSFDSRIHSFSSPIRFQRRRRKNQKCKILKGNDFLEVKNQVIVLLIKEIQSLLLAGIEFEQRENSAVPFVGFPSSEGSDTRHKI